MAEPQLLAQVNDRAKAVQTALTRGIAACDSKFLGGQPAASAASALRALKPSIDAWATRGVLAAQTGKLPTATDGKTSITWAKWIDAGEVKIQGINEITGLGLDSNLELIKESVAAIPADTKKVVTAIAKTTAKVVQETADVTGGVVGSLIRPLLIPLGIAAAGLVAFAVIKTKGGA